MRIGRRLVLATCWLLGAGCLAPDSGFGRRCVDHAECTSGDLCVGGLCVPEREPGDAGEDCARPITLDQPSPGALPAMGEAAFAGAGPDVEASCTALDDLVFRFQLGSGTDDDDERDLEVGLRVHVDAPFVTSVSLHPLDGGVCQGEVPDGCATAGDLLAARVGPGEWAVVVHGAAATGEIVQVTVEQLPCPVGYLPWGDGRCAGFREVMPGQLERHSAKLTALPDGRAILTGGLEVDGLPADAGEVFEPASETWSYVAFRSRRSTHSPVLLGDRFMVMGGGKPAEILDAQPGAGDGVMEIDYDPSVGLDDTIDEDSHELGAGLPSGRLLLVVDHDSWLLEIESPSVLCQVDTQCLGYLGAVCVGRPALGGDGFCLCDYGPCRAPPVLRDRPTIAGAGPVGAATAARPLVAAARDDAELVLLHNGDAVHELDVGSAFWRTIAVTPRDAVALDAIPNGLVITGGSEGTVPSALVEVLDTATRTRTDPLRMREARVDHGHATLEDGRVLVVGGWNNGGTLDSAEIVDALGGAAPQLPRLPVPLAHAAAARLADGRVLVVGTEERGALMTRAFVFEVVQPGFAPPPLDPDTRCGPVVRLPDPLPTSEDTAARILESTQGERDRFRGTGCGEAWRTTGPERLFSFQLAEPRAFFALTEDNFSALTLWRGSCGDQAELGCIATGNEADRLEAPTLEPGAYTLVVEDHSSYWDPSGVPFALQVWTTDPYACPPSAEDPGDDTPETARPMQTPNPSDDPRYAAQEYLAGSLCGDDVDHVLLYLWSESSQVVLENASRELTTLSAAVFDEDATLAAGEPVFTFDAPMSFGRGNAPPGIYLLTLGTGTDDPLRHPWSVRLVPGHCVPDAEDSLAPMLDDANYPPGRQVLEPGEPLQRCLTDDSDVDILVFEVPADVDTAVAVEQGWEVSAQVFALQTPDGPLGAPVGESVSAGLSIAIAAGAAPWAAVVLRSERTSGEPYTVRLLRTEPGDGCLNAFELADSGTLPYDSAIYSNDLTPEVLGHCTGYAAFGDDIVGTLTLSEGDRLNATLTPVDDSDPSLYLLVSCEQSESSCVAGADEGATGTAESLVWTHHGPARVYYLVGDSYYSEAYSAVLTWNVTRAGQ